MKLLLVAILTLGSLSVFSQTVPLHFPAPCYVSSSKIVEKEEVKATDSYLFQLSLSEQTKASSIKVGLRKYRITKRSCGDMIKRKGWVKGSIYKMTRNFSFKIDPSSDIRPELILPYLKVVNNAAPKFSVEGKSAYHVEIIDFNEVLIGTQIDEDNIQEVIYNTSVLIKLTPKS